MKILPAILVTFAHVAIGQAAAREPIPTAIFAFGFDNTSLEGQMDLPRPDEQARLSALDKALRDALVQSDCCAPVDPALVARQAQGIDTQSCNGCEVQLARKVGARISVIGWVQKVSNLILNINIVARSVTTGNVIGAGSVDIRGNTDESWSRGLSYLVRNRLHPSDWR